MIAHTPIVRIGSHEWRTASSCSSRLFIDLLRTIITRVEEHPESLRYLELPESVPEPTDEQILWEAGRNRVYAGIRKLRELGLQAVLLTLGEGYLLDPSVPVCFASREDSDGFR